MNEDLYGVLGVGRDADRAEIRRAYRRKAKNTHPDTGGSPEKFALIKRAHDTLTDNGRRQRYDATGNSDDPIADNSHAEAVQAAIAAMDEVLTVCAQRAFDPLSVDLVADAAKTLEIKIEKNKVTEQKLRNVLSLNQKIAKRFSPKKGRPDYLGNAIRQRIADIERQMDVVLSERAKFKTAIGIVRDHKFDWTATDRSDANRLAIHMGPLIGAAFAGM